MTLITTVATLVNKVKPLMTKLSLILSSEKLITASTYPRLDNQLKSKRRFSSEHTEGIELAQEKPEEFRIFPLQARGITLSFSQKLIDRGKEDTRFKGLYKPAVDT